MPEIGPSTSFLTFVKAVIDQWAALTTGGVVIAVLALWERWHRPVPRKVYAGIVGVALVTAFYLTWAAERQKYIELSQTLDTQHLEIVDLKFKKYARITKYSLDAWVINRGPQATSNPVPIKNDPIYTNADLPREEVERIMHGLEDDAKKAKITSQYSLTNQLFPGQPYIVTIADDFLTDEQINEINSGSLAVYVFVILTYRVKGMAENHYRATEYCASYAGGVDYRHNIVSQVVDWDR
jgi:hypothetical protein